MSLLLYVACPVSAPTPAGLVANIEIAKRWYRWLTEATPHDISMPWLAPVETFAVPAGSDVEFRDRGMRSNLRALDRHDAIVLCGGRVSAGMQLEADHAHKRGLRIASLISFGAEPPVGLQSLEAVARLAKELG